MVGYTHQSRASKASSFLAPITRAVTWFLPFTHINQTQFLTFEKDQENLFWRQGVKRFLEKFIPSPMQEESLPLPKEGHMVQRSEDEISRALTFDMTEAPPLNPQRAQLAFYRSQTEQIASYNPVE